MTWYRDRGLTHMVERTCESELICNALRTSKALNYPDIEIGDTYEIEDVKVHYCAGRIDIRDDSKYGYDGWDEYGVSPMHAEDWGALSDWLDHHVTPELWTYEELIDTFEKKCLKRKIRWWKDEDECD
jgi:hypothetical protein